MNDGGKTRANLCADQSRQFGSSVGKFPGQLLGQITFNRVGRGQEAIHIQRFLEFDVCVAFVWPAEIYDSVQCDLTCSTRFDISYFKVSRSN